MKTMTLILLAATAASAQDAAPKPALPPLPAPLAVPKPGPAGETAYAPQPILPGGVVLPLYAPGSPFLKADRIKEPEKYNMSQVVPGFAKQSRTASAAQVKSLPVWRAQRPILNRAGSRAKAAWYGRRDKDIAECGLRIAEFIVSDFWIEG